jgi:Fe-Mn family superoxide dismutase
MKLSELFEIEDTARVYELPQLPYSYDALEPHIDAETMMEHHQKHQKGYVDKLNGELEDYPQLRKPLEDILKNINSYNTDVRNNAGGVYNHTFFWNLLSPQKTLPTGKLKMSILSQWGSIDDFIAEFIEVGKKKFGSGWVWLVWNEVEEGLKIISTPNQDNPLMFDGMIPIIGCDLWEHAYYLKHKSNREGWLNTFFEVINWDYAGKVYNDTVK